MRYRTERVLLYPSEILISRPHVRATEDCDHSQWQPVFSQRCGEACNDGPAN